MPIYPPGPGCRDKRLVGEIVSTEWFESHGKCTLQHPRPEAPQDVKLLTFRVIDDLSGEAAKLSAEQLLGRHCRYNIANCQVTDVEMLNPVEELRLLNRVETPTEDPHGPVRRYRILRGAHSQKEVDAEGNSKVVSYEAVKGRDVFESSSDMLKHNRAPTRPRFQLLGESGEVLSPGLPAPQPVSEY